MQNVHKKGYSTSILGRINIQQKYKEIQMQTSSGFTDVQGFKNLITEFPPLLEQRQLIAKILFIASNEPI